MRTCERFLHTLQHSGFRHPRSAMGRGGWARRARKQSTNQEIENLIRRIAKEGTGEEEPREFKDLPISAKTLEGLTENRFETMTAIQRAAIPYALSGRDILGSAKTGSGKTVLNSLLRLLLTNS